MIINQDIWRDPIWQSVDVIVALVFGVISLSLGIITVWAARRRKSLTYEVLSVTPLVTIKDDVGGRVKIMLDNEPISDAKLALIKLTNSGNIPIQSNDYEQPLKISLNENAKILSAGITEVVPKSLMPSVEQDGNSIVLTPLLLNRADSVTIKILASQFEETFTVTGRVIGVSDIKELRLTSASFGRFMFIFGILFIIIVGCIYGVLILLGQNPDKGFFFAMSSYCGLLSLIGLFFLLFPNAADKLFSKQSSSSSHPPF